MNLLYYILNQPEDSILKKVFNEQTRSPSRNDWVNLIKNDMKVLKINLSYCDIKSTPKNSLKNFIKKKIREAAFAYLNILKKKHSKVEGINYDSLKIQAYFSANDCEKSIQDIQDLFKIRARMLEVKTNMKGSHYEYNCDECLIVGSQIEDDQPHILNCPIINADKNQKERRSDYSEIFGMDVTMQINVSKEIMENMKIRETFRKGI